MTIWHFKLDQVYGNTQQTIFLTYACIKVKWLIIKPVLDVLPLNALTGTKPNVFSVYKKGPLFKLLRNNHKTADQ